MLGNPTKLAPIPNPIPCLAALPMLGAYMSSTANVAAAVIAIITISSTFIFFLWDVEGGYSYGSTFNKVFYGFLRTSCKSKAD